jgi:predicted TIM-barrel fold metal-dependent hydrolase
MTYQPKIGAAATTSTQAMLFNADGHVIEPPHLWTKYLDKKYQDRAPKLVKDPMGGDAWELVPGETPMPIGLVTNSGEWGRRYEDNHWHGFTYDKVRQGAFVGKERLVEQDIDGVEAEVIFPSQRTMWTFMAQSDDGFHEAGLEAYNTWLHDEFCAADPKRIIGLAQMPSTNIDSAVRALKSAKTAGFRGVIISGYPSGGPTLSADDDPFWAAAQDLQMPVHIHVGLPNAGKRTEARAAVRNMVSNPTMQQLGGAVAGSSDWLSRFIYSEMFDRFPSLKLILAETGAGWIPHFLEFNDDAWWRNRVWTKSRLKFVPSEYFRRNCMVTFIREPFAILNRHSIGVSNMMWSSDYPHHRHDWPYSRRIVTEQFTGVPVPERDAMVYGNAKALYGL